MEENIIQINGRITINIDVTVKNIIYGKKLMFGIVLQVDMKMENIYQILWMTQQLYVTKL